MPWIRDIFINSALTQPSPIEYSIIFRSINIIKCNKQFPTHPLSRTQLHFQTNIFRDIHQNINSEGPKLTFLTSFNEKSDFLKNDQSYRKVIKGDCYYFLKILKLVDEIFFTLNRLSAIAKFVCAKLVHGTEKYHLSGSWSQKYG